MKENPHAAFDVGRSQVPDRPRHRGQERRALSRIHRRTDRAATARSGSRPAVLEKPHRPQGRRRRGLRPHRSLNHGRSAPRAASRHRFVQAEKTAPFGPRSRPGVSHEPATYPTQAPAYTGPRRRPPRKKSFVLPTLLQQRPFYRQHRAPTNAPSVSTHRTLDGGAQATRTTPLLEGLRLLRDNQGEKGATIRMRMAPGLTDEGRA